MATTDNKTIVRRFCEEMLSQHNLDVAGDLFTSDFVDHDPDNPAGRRAGVAGAKEEVGAYITAFPDMRVTIQDLVAEADRVVMRGVLTGTHQGPMMGIPPTSKPVEVGALQIYRIADGKIAEAWLQIDRLGMLQQLGLIPAPPSWSIGR